MGGVNQNDPGGQKPLMRAIQASHLGCAELSISAGADVNSLSDKTFVPIIYGTYQ